MKIVAVIVGLAALLSGCATYQNGALDTVHITSMPEQAQYTITDANGKVIREGKTPDNVVLMRGNGYFTGQTYKVDFALPGYQPASVTADTEVNKWYFGNLLFGGTIGTFIVDPSSGAMWSVPDVSANLTPQ